MDQQTGRTGPTSEIISPDADTLRLLVESTTDYAIFLLDPQGYVASWNLGAQRIKGYTAQEIVGRHFSTFYTEEAVARKWPDYELVEAARVGRFEDEGWRVRRDGTHFYANVVLTALREPDGGLRGFAKVTRDISERKAHEQRIERLTRELEGRVVQLAATNRELEQKSAENESFVYSVSHDLRSPLVNLQGFSQELALSATSLETLLQRPDVPADVRAQAQTLIRGELAESISFIHDAVKHLSRIIDGLLRLSRVGRVEYESNDVDVNVVVSEILAAMHTTVATSGAQVVVHTLPHVNGDRNAIGQIFANIVGNALKSFDSGRPGRVEIFATGDSPPVFAIRDNGVGIPEEYQPRLFQVFQHLRRSESDGEGMGLAIARRVVDRHGGKIWCESSPGHGTTFFFTLAGDAPFGGRHAAGQRRMSAPIGLLIAEDDEGHATLVQRNLRRGGLVADLVHLRDGQELIDYLYRRASFEHRPEHSQIAVLLDLNMPRLGGFEVLRRVKADETLARIPVFVLTTTDNPAEIDRCYRMGAAACLVKPLDYGGFGVMVQRLAGFLMTVQMPPETTVERLTT